MDRNKEDCCLAGCFRAIAETEQAKAYKDYVEKHIENVERCYKALTGENLYSHDESKYSEEEFEPYMNFFYNEDGTRKTGERDEATRDAFNKAWLHHIQNNPHHWQHWVIPGSNEPVEMPLRYVVEMVADWGGMALAKSDPVADLTGFYENVVMQEYIFHAETEKKVRFFVSTMCDILGHME